MKGPLQDMSRYLEAVHQLKGVVLFFSTTANYESCQGLLNHVNGVLSKAAQMIEDGFRLLMGACSKPVDPDCLFDWLSKLICTTSNGNPEAVEGQPSQSSALHRNRNPTLIPPEELPLLRDMAYQDARTSLLELILRKLGVQERNKDDIQSMQLEDLKTEIENWNQFMQIAVTVLLTGERINCDMVFDGIAFNKEKCFAELARPSFMTLLSFGDAIAKSKMPPEKLFVLLDMYGGMRGIQAKVEVVFQGRYCSEMRESLLNLTKSLAQTAKAALVDFVETVEKDSKNMIQDGNVHPLTIHVISCAKSLFEYQSTLENIQPFETGSATESQLAVVTKKIWQALQNNLDGRLNLFNDSALSYIFLMNNIHCMVTSVRGSAVKHILGDDWIQRHRRIVQQNANQYKRVAWGKILETFSVPAGGSPGPSASDLSSTEVSRTIIKGRFKSFNKQFEEIHTVQSQWSIPDKELRDALRLAVAEVLVPAYRSFVNRFGTLIERGKNPHKYMKHSPEKVEQMLGELFGGEKIDEERQ